jgi:hypothetical protein
VAPGEGGRLRRPLLPRLRVVPYAGANATQPMLK